MYPNDTTPSPVVQPPAGPPAPKHSRKFRILRATGISIAAIIAIGVIAGSLGGHKTAATATAPKATTISAPATVTHKAVKVTPKVTHAAPAAAATPPAPAAPAATTPAMTASEQQAVDAARGYLAMGSGFSQYSLTRQLTSTAGSGFAPADARFAISYLHPDWDTQAVEAAKGYMQMGGFSAASLTQQLTSDYGDGFTQAQAEYAVAQVGL